MTDFHSYFIIYLFSFIKAQLHC